ncbi:MAG: hypothetical protein SPI91_00315 [Bacilli bacterium]|nr:hypothetical protein [Bacilli bacterium]
MIKSVLSPKVEVRTNSLNGKGIFAKESIKAGEIVFIKGGHILTRDKIYSSGVINSYFPISDEYFLAAQNKDEELTVDYAFIDNEDYSFKCTCGSTNCRGTITGFDWKIKELQEKYYDYFAQYLKDKINEERNKENGK